MYTDFRLTDRDSWKFTYTGAQLLAGAKSKLKVASLREQELRQTLVQLVSNPAVGVNSKRVEDTKREIESVAEIREKLIVFVHEFAREPDRDYRLSIGDVVFFGLVDTTLQA